MPSRRLAAALGLMLAAAGCASAEPAGTPAGDPAVTSTLSALPDCSSPPVQPPGLEDVEGLILPEGSVMTGVTKQDPLVTVQAFVPLTPVQFEAAYPEMDGITVLITENEVYEAELLVSNGEHRNFFKATATCATGSKVLAVVAPEVDAEGLPVPQRATATPTPTPPS